MAGLGSFERTWSALVEAKTKKNLLEQEQVTKYLEAAKVSGINAMGQTEETVFLFRSKPYMRFRRLNRYPP